MRSLKFLTFLLIFPIVINFQVAIAQTANQFFNQGTAAHRAGDYKKAESSFRQYIKLEPNNAEGHYRLGRALREQERFDEAIAEFNQAIRLNPKHSYAYNGLCTVFLYGQNKLDDAVTACRQAIEIYPKNSEAYNNLGYALVEQQNLEEALDAFRKAMQVASNNDQKYVAYVGIAYILRLQGREEEAITEYQKAIQLDPTDSTAYINLGHVLTDQNRLNEAINAYSQAIKLDPQDATSYYNLGRVYYLQKNYRQAIALYRRAIQIDPKNPYPHNGLGIIFIAQGNLEQAITELQTALKLDPNFSDAQNNLREAQRVLAFQNPQLYRTENAQRPVVEGTLTQAYKATVLITPKAADGNFGKQGTGWVVKREDNTVWIVTNRHVVVSNEKLKQFSKEIFVQFYSDSVNAKPSQYRATVEKFTNFNDLKLDLAVLRVTGVTSDIQAFDYRLGIDPRSVRVRIIGHPITVKQPWSVVSGEVINFNSQTEDMDIDANLADGNSGSPVLNEQQQVIGMIVQTGTKNDVDPDPNKPTPKLSEDSSATRGVGTAYRIDKVIEQLRTWKILE